MIEVLVAAILATERLCSIVVGTIPLECEVDILRDVATKRQRCVVAHVTCDVQDIVDHRRCTCPAVARHNVEVTLDRRDREAVAYVRTQRA